jgi:hypothetical protein
VVATNLRALLKLDVALTTGNSYTVVSAIEAALEAARLTGANLEESRAAVVGGGGSIGSALASLLAERVASLVLVTRESDAAAMRSRYAAILARMVRHLRRRALEGAEFRVGSLAHELGRLECGAELPERGRIRLDPGLEDRLLPGKRASCRCAGPPSWLPRWPPRIWSSSARARPESCCGPRWCSRGPSCATCRGLQTWARICIAARMSS